MKSARKKILSNSLVLLGALAAYLLSACSEASPLEPPPQVIQVFVTATPAAPSATPTTTSTPTPTPTPTATAQPIAASGDPRALAVQPPTPEVGAYCGWVDTFDFPLDPPDAPGIRGGQDFGVFRSRYGKLHAGEDWGIRGGGSLGAPVHAIGHGTVTYAEGNGWGLDLGVVIIRHYFPDGSTVLSFYGHLDPPSVTLVPGQCVLRGDVVGNIGDPSSSPHLHFEIRTTMPHVPGPGYWSVDPATAGWLPPSETIWARRMSLMPDFRWQSTDFEIDSLLGFAGDQTYLVAADDFIAGLYTPGGGVRWLHLFDPAVFRVAYAPDSGLAYTITASGLLTALAMPAAGQPGPDSGYLVPAWQAQVAGSAAPALVPFPGGGIAVLGHGRITAYAPDGERLWSETTAAPTIAHLTTGAYLLVATAGDSGGLAAYTAAGRAWDLPGIAGRLAAAGDSIYVLGSDALFRIDPLDPVPELLAALPRASGTGDILVLDNGQVLVLHSDLQDRRLLLFNEAGLLWERSVGELVSGTALLHAVDGRVVLVSQAADPYQQIVRVHLLDPEGPALELIFEGGTRLPDSGVLEVGSTGDGALLLRFGEHSLVAVEVR